MNWFLWFIEIFGFLSVIFQVVMGIVTYRNYRESDVLLKQLRDANKNNSTR